MTKFGKACSAIAAVGLLSFGLGFSAPSQAAQIQQCIAPADPGGGWDFTCRSVGRLLHKLGLVDSPVQVINMPGGVGAVAYADVSSKRAGDSSLIVATSTVGVAQIAQGRYPRGADAMRWLGMLGTDVGVVLVAKDSPYDNLKQVLDQLVDDPSSVVLAGSSGVGGWDQVRMLMLAEAAGLPSDKIAHTRWVQFDGGGPAVVQLMGGSVDIVSTDLGEIAGFIKSGDVRVLAVLSDDPLPEPFDDLPTAIAQGYDVVGYNWRGFYTGGDVSDADYEAMVATLKKVYDSPEWKAVAKKHGLTAIWRGGDEFEDFVHESIDKIKKISRDIGVIK